MPNKPKIFKPVRLKTRKDADVNRPNAAARGYCSKSHRAWRKAVLSRAGFQCQKCGIILVTGSLHADHVVPINEGGDRYNVENGMALCPSCHSRKTAMENSHWQYRRRST